MTLRKILFWTHLVAGVVAGSVILIMCVTGTLLTFQQSVLRVIERAERVVASPPAPGRHGSTSTRCWRTVRLAFPDAQPTTVTLDSDPRRPPLVAVGHAGHAVRQSLHRRGARHRVAAGPRVLPFGHQLAPVARRRRRRTGHRARHHRRVQRRLSRPGGDGLYLWRPRQWSWRHVAPVIWFRRGLRGKPRDFNWHNTIGLWCAPILIVLTTTGMVISYPWASNLVYTLTGSPRPAAAAVEPGARGGAAAPAAAPRSADAKPAPSLESVVDQAETSVPTWRTMIIRLPPRPGGPVAFSMSDRDYWNSFARSTLTLDRASGATRWEPYAQTTLGQKVRGWMRFAHTGELGGLPGEAVAGLASLGGAFLMWTGLALALRRLAAWRSRRAARLASPVSTEGATTT